MRISARMDRLERFMGPRFPEGDCPEPMVGVIVDKGEPIPEDVPRCRNCGGQHVLVLEIVEVAAPA